VIRPVTHTQKVRFLVDNFIYFKRYLILGNKMADLPIAAVIRIAKANGAERVGKDAADLLVKKAEEYIGQLTKDAEKMASHAGRKTLKEEDIEMASQKK
jgi:histone H3/H4